MPAPAAQGKVKQYTVESAIIQCGISVDRCMHGTRIFGFSGVESQGRHSDVARKIFVTLKKNAKKKKPRKSYSSKKIMLNISGSPVDMGMNMKVYKNHVLCVYVEKDC
jgi:hypothetical protein